MGQDLEMATRRPGVVELQEAEQEKQLNDSAALDNGSPSSSNRNDVDQMEEGYNSGAANSGGSAKAIDLIGGIACQNNEDPKEGEDSDGVEGSDRGASNSPVMNDKYASGTSMPTLELSLKRSRVPGDDDVEVEERRAVRQSGGSAFSRYFLHLSIKCFPVNIVHLAFCNALFHSTIAVVSDLKRYWDMSEPAVLVCPLSDFPSHFFRIVTLQIQHEWSHHPATSSFREQSRAWYLLYGWRLQFVRGTVGSCQQQQNWATSPFYRIRSMWIFYGQWGSFNPTCKSPSSSSEGQRSRFRIWGSRHVWSRRIC